MNRLEAIVLLTEIVEVAKRLHIGDDISKAKAWQLIDKIQQNGAGVGIWIQADEAIEALVNES
jgi:hypothetical protein